MKKIIFFQILLLISSAGGAQDTLLRFYEQRITPQKILKHLEVLANDSLEGRETGEQGMIKASDYVAGELHGSGIMPANGSSYFQEMSFFVNKGSAISIISESDTFVAGRDYYSSELSSVNKTINTEIIFVGYGITDTISGWNDYENLSVEGKVVMILDGIPKNKKGAFLNFSNISTNDQNSNRKIKVQTARNNGASAIFFINRNLSYKSAGMQRWVTNGKYILSDNYTDVEQPLIYITTSMANQLFNSTKLSLADYEKHVYKKKIKAKYLNIKSGSITINYSPILKNCRNVAGILEGSDKKDEYVVISAHLDHLGMNGDVIYNGADDDGSGCSSMLTIADVFSNAAVNKNRPRRSILFIFFTGEEKGLLGSEFYVNNPLVSLEHTIADLNIDMIGRVDDKERDTKNYTYIIGSDRMSTELHELNETANNNCCNLILDYTYNDPSHRLKLYERSDHYNFVKKDIPVIFYFTGLHEDYHKPSDTINKVDVEKTALIARLVFNTAWELANKEDRIKPDDKKD